MESSVPGEERENICITDNQIEKDNGCTYLQLDRNVWLHINHSLFATCYTDGQNKPPPPQRCQNSSEIREEERTKEHVHSILA